MVSNNRSLSPGYQNADRYMRWPEVHRMCGLGRTRVHELIKEGRFPRQHKIVKNGRAAAWLESEILAWLEQRIADNSPDSPEAA